MMSDLEILILCNKKYIYFLLVPPKEKLFNSSFHDSSFVPVMFLRDAHNALCKERHSIAIIYLSNPFSSSPGKIIIGKFDIKKSNTAC